MVQYAALAHAHTRVNPVPPSYHPYHPYHPRQPSRWCNMRLRHTSTYGVRIYRRDSMLIDHVDRMDTHLASAVLQVCRRRVGVR